MVRQNYRRKPISFDTTLRNPRRIPQFISILKEFEGKILDDEVALQLEAEIICQKVFEPTRGTLGTYVKHYNTKFAFSSEDQSSNASNKVSEYYSEWERSDKGEFDRNKMIYLLKNTITAHKEAGWKGGWESRIHTQFNFLNELGFVRVVKNSEILISENGNLMIKEYINGYPKNEIYDESYEESAFLNAFARYQINNPYRRNTISINFFPLILSTISYYNEKYGKSGLSIQDLPFIITWGISDHSKLAELIYKFRNKFGYNTSTELVYEYAMNSLDESSQSYELKPATKEFIKEKQKDYKYEKITKETPDEIIRKLRLTMLISLRGGGRFIDLNTLENEKINHVISNCNHNTDFGDDYISYFNYMGRVDSQLVFKISEIETSEAKDAKTQAIINWSIEKDWEFLSQEMTTCVNKNASSDSVLKYVTETVRLEFLSAIVLKKALPNAVISANYKADDQGIPFSVAQGSKNGNIGTDIDVYEDEVHAIVEPTISLSRSFQTEHELPSIRNHILESHKFDSVNNKHIKDWFALFIASNIARDVGDQVALMSWHQNVNIFPWDIEDFVDYSKNVTSIKDYKVIREYAKHQKIYE